MTELFTRTAASADVTPDTAREALGLILSFMRSEGDGQAVGQMIEATPGAGEAEQSAGDTDFTGGIMALGAKLMGLGLDMGQIRSLAEEFVAVAKENSDEATVSKAIASVPGLAPFV